MAEKKILVIGASGQLGSELTLTLRDKYGVENVIASDINEPKIRELEQGPFQLLNVMNLSEINSLIKKHGITQIYHLAAMLSAKGEQHPLFAWDLNMQGLINVLEAARVHNLDKVYWPSSIAVFGPSTPKINTPQHCMMDPTTIYGISKLAGEQWCHYYFKKYGVDVRSLRYPGLIGYKTQPGGGTTDYAVDVFHKAVAGDKFESFLDKGTYLPMMYMDDAIRATIELMEAPEVDIRVRTSYNLSAMSFSPDEVEVAIQHFLPDFEMSYAPDFRQEIAESWPQSIDDTQARTDWGWKEEFDLLKMTETMLDALQEKAKIKSNL